MAEATFHAWNCALCGVSCSRPTVRGQKPKWCDPCRRRTPAKIAFRTCKQCGSEYRGIGEKFCSIRCSSDAQARPEKPVVEKAPHDRRSPIAKAIDEEDWSTLLILIRNRAQRDLDGCWRWPNVDRDGYPRLIVKGKTIGVHRLSLSAKLSGHLGSQAAHHACANRACVNPEHLQAITDRENIAEMNARQSYLRRIRELEEALARLDPSHPLLGMLPLH